MGEGGGGSMQRKKKKNKAWLQIAFAIVGEVTGASGTTVQLKPP